MSDVAFGQAEAGAQTVVTLVSDAGRSDWRVAEHEDTETVSGQKPDGGGLAAGFHRARMVAYAPSVAGTPGLETGAA
ncbi:MAG: hypothetical protein OXQ28_01540 [Acidobacteriota bacterium]|nr:hypothetical protein [Acidobacteriota bacterium]